tara:strand:+ start:1111 stop:1536 length:426 start_codon:yes stop_codon:yes gene_type:complete
MDNGLSIEAIGSEIFKEHEREAAELFVRFEEKFTDEKKWIDLVPEILSRQYQLCIVRDAGKAIAVALTFVKDDARKTCVISHCAGHGYEQWVDQLLVTIRVWSHSLGSTKLEIVARPGWERILRPLGMVKTHVIMELKSNG